MTLNVAGVWDIECGDWDRFLCGEALSIDGEALVSWDADDFADWMFSRKGIWYAHAGGRYDALWLLDVAIRRGLRWEARCRGAGLLSVKIGDLEVRDSFALVPMGLAKCSAMGSARKLELHLPCMGPPCREKDCAGYCQLGRIAREGPSRAERRTIERYLHADCEALLSMLDSLEHRAAALGINLGLTVGGTAWKTAKRWLDLPDCSHSLGTYERIREAYYGGRVEGFRTFADSGHGADIHNAYTAALTRVHLPEGPGAPALPRAASRYFAAGKPCIVSCDVRVPETNIPPLPFRHPDRLLYPHGRFSGCWTSVQLQHAVEHGVVIERVTGGYVWETARPFLREYAEKVWGMRASHIAMCTCTREDKKAGRACYGCAFGGWFKWLANSLTGKLAQRPEHESLVFKPNTEWGDGVPLRKFRSGSLWPVERVRVDACAHVQLSAFLTSENGCELHRQLLHAPDPYYTDTDCVKGRTKLTRRMGPGLGEWGDEGAFTDWRLLACKVYSYTDEKGEKVVRGKGMSGLDADGFTRLAAGDEWASDRGVEGMRTAVRKYGTEDNGSIFARKHMTRSLQNIPGWIGGRIHDERTGLTRPCTVEEYDAASDVRRFSARMHARRRKEAKQWAQ